MMKRMTPEEKKIAAEHRRIERQKCTKAFPAAFLGNAHEAWLSVRGGEADLLYINAAGHRSELCLDYDLIAFGRLLRALILRYNSFVEQANLEVGDLRLASLDVAEED
jgi:hypothetical protein